MWRISKPMPNIPRWQRKKPHWHYQVLNFRGKHLPVADKFSVSVIYHPMPQFLSPSYYSSQGTEFHGFGFWSSPGSISVLSLVFCLIVFTCSVFCSAVFVYLYPVVPVYHCKIFIVHLFPWFQCFLVLYSPLHAFVVSNDGLSLFNVACLCFDAHGGFGLQFLDLLEIKLRV